jgi:hypothetical protein
MLSSEELVLRRELKFKCLGLASLARPIARQRSRPTFLKEGDTNTKFFHLHACHQGCKSFIDHLLHQGATVVHESEKAQLVFDHFDAILGATVDCMATLDLNILNISTMQLTGLDRCFSEDEVWQIVRALPPDKAPGLDGFTGLFYQSAWPIMKFDIMQAWPIMKFNIMEAFHAFWQLDSHSFHLVNQAYMVLLKKKPDVDQVQAYMVD